ncbi:MAG: putative toxin-antitoxin system toxin component, PIN family [Cyanobacteria bacterium J06639_1]
MATRLVLDTNVLIAALIGKAGPNREILRRCLTGRYQPLISNTLFLEYVDVTSRESILKLCPASQQEVDDLRDALCSVCEWISIYYLWRPNLTDESDNHVFELAVAGNAAMIVSNNVRDFQGTQVSFPELEMVTPEQLLRGE